MLGSEKRFYENKFKEEIDERMIPKAAAIFVQWQTPLNDERILFGVGEMQTNNQFDSLFRVLWRLHKLSVLICQTSKKKLAFFEQ